MHGGHCPTACRANQPQQQYVQPFDIFKIAKGGELYWLGATESLEAAVARVDALRESLRCDYMIVSHRTSKRILFSASGGMKRD